MILEVLLLLLAIYLLCGLVFAIPFVWLGVGKTDPHAVHGSWGFRLLIIPGTMFFWPLLAARWVNRCHVIRCQGSGPPSGARRAKEGISPARRSPRGEGECQVFDL